MRGDEPATSSHAQRRCSRSAGAGWCTRSTWPSATRTRASWSSSSVPSSWLAASRTAPSRRRRSSGSGSCTRSCGATAPRRCATSRTPTTSPRSSATRSPCPTRPGTSGSPTSTPAGKTRRGRASRSRSRSAAPTASCRAWPRGCSRSARSRPRRAATKRRASSCSRLARSPSRSARSRSSAASRERSLSFPEGSFRADGAAALDWVADYLERVRELPVLSQAAPGELRARLPTSPPETAEPFANVLRDLDDVLLPGLTHWQSPRFFAYFPSTGSEPGILAELLIAGLNQVGILWRTSPALQELEELTLDWLAQLLGLPDGLHGHIEDTASTCTMAALAAARQAKPGARVVVTSEQAHSSVEKACRLLELELRLVPVDETFSMRPD